MTGDDGSSSSVQHWEEEEEGGVTGQDGHSAGERRVRGKESEQFGRDRLVRQASIPTTCRASDGS